MEQALNNIAQVLNWDVVLMGIVSLVGLVLALLIAAPDGPTIGQRFWEHRNTIDRIRQLPKWAMALVILVGTYYAGVVANTFCDVWVDRDWMHLWLRRIPDLLSFTIESDDNIKLAVYGMVYPEFVDTPKREVLALYYHAKNTLWQDSIWREYMLYSQKMINISRVWAFVFFILILAGSVRFLWHLWHRKMVDAVKDLAKFVILPMIGYSLGLLVWADSEREMDSKVFGIYRTEHGIPPQAVFAVGKPHFVRSSTTDPFEPSGVARRGPHLFIVNDKKDELYIHSASTGRFENSVPIEDEGRSKFEAIAYYEPDNEFYAIGAYFKDEYKNTVRLKVSDSESGWKVEAANIDLHGAIDEARDKVGGSPSVEGLAVYRQADKLKFLIGLRTGPEVTAASGFRLARLRLEGTTGVFEEVFSLAHFPKKSNDGTPYHLSDLFLDEPAKLYVLASSETEGNVFHGNRIYCFDFRSCTQVFVTDEFGSDHKAEGLVLWESPLRIEAAIVFDDDFENTGKRGSLLVGSLPSTIDLGIRGFVNSAAASFESPGKE